MKPNTLRSQCRMPAAAAKKLDVLMDKQLTLVAKYHGLTEEQLFNFAINLGEPYAFAACMLLLRPGIKNKFRKNLREQLLPRLSGYTAEWSFDTSTRPKYPAPLSPKQLDAVQEMHEVDLMPYVTLFHVVNWSMITSIVEPLESTEMAGARIVSDNYEAKVNNN